MHFAVLGCDSHTLLLRELNPLIDLSFLIKLRYLDFMTNWTKVKPSYMSVAYVAERSIEDELNRTGQSDVTTIAISYLIMFAYIAIALGQARSFSRLLVR